MEIHRRLSFDVAFLHTWPTQNCKRNPWKFKNALGLLRQILLISLENVRKGQMCLCLQACQGFLYFIGTSIIVTWYFLQLLRDLYRILKMVRSLNKTNKMASFHNIPVSQIRKSVIVPTARDQAQI